MLVKAVLKKEERNRTGRDKRKMLCLKVRLQADE